MKTKSGIIFLIVSLFVPCHSYAKVNGILSFISGKVLINGKSANIGDTVLYGDKITTQGKSVCEIRIEEKSILRIQGDSELIFHVDETRSVLEFVKGWLSFVSHKRSIAISTPTSIAGIRGTALCIKSGDPESTYACTCNGTIRWRKKGEDTEEVISSAHHCGRHYKLMNGKVNSKPIGMLYHTDKDIEDLAAKINLAIDWAEPKD